MSLSTISNVRNAFNTATSDYKDTYANYLRAMDEKGVDDKHYRVYLDYQKDIVARELQLQKDGVPTRTLSDIRNDVYTARQRAVESQQRDPISRDVNIIVKDDDIVFDEPNKSNEIGPDVD